MTSHPVQTLIVEDVAPMRQLLAHALSGIEGYSVSGTAASGWEARIEISKRRPDLILLDEVLPGESLTELLEAFSEQGVTVILLTGMDQPAHDLPARVRGRLVKPGWKTLAQDRLRIKAELDRLLIQG